MPHDDQLDPPDSVLSFRHVFKENSGLSTGVYRRGGAHFRRLVHQLGRAPDGDAETRGRGDTGTAIAGVSQHSFTAKKQRHQDAEKADDTFPVASCDFVDRFSLRQTNTIHELTLTTLMY